MKRTSALAVSTIAALAIFAIESDARAETPASPAWTYAFPQSLFGAGWFSPLRNDNYYSSYYSSALDFQSGSNRPAVLPPGQSGGACRRRGTPRGLELQRNEYYGF